MAEQQAICMIESHRVSTAPLVLLGNMSVFNLKHLYCQQKNILMFWTFPQSNQQVQGPCTVHETVVRLLLLSSILKWLKKIQSKEMNDVLKMVLFTLNDSYAILQFLVTLHETLTSRYSKHSIPGSINQTPADISFQIENDELSTKKLINLSIRLVDTGDMAILIEESIKKRWLKQKNFNIYRRFSCRYRVDLS